MLPLYVNTDARHLESTVDSQAALKHPSDGMGTIFESALKDGQLLALMIGDA